MSRFLVLCSYQPETLTVRAGINLPTNHQFNIGRGQAQMASMPYEEDNSIGRRSRNLRTGRRLQHPQALGMYIYNIYIIMQLNQNPNNYVLQDLFHYKSNMIY